MKRSESLPADLLAYLMTSNRRWTLDDGEIRELTLYAAGEIALKEFDVTSHERFLDGPLIDDPDEVRVYSGYDLIESCEGYDPEGILIWFPEWNEYGSWDCDHHTIIAYPGVRWPQIVAGPTWYVNGQWYPDRVAHRRIDPWKRRA